MLLYRSAPPPEGAGEKLSRYGALLLYMRRRDWLVPASGIAEDDF